MSEFGTLSISLPVYKSLNEVEELFSKDLIDQVREIEMDFSERFSEICASHKAYKCLDYLIEKSKSNPDTHLSPLLNLYLIRDSRPVVKEVSHDSELYHAFYYDRLELITGRQIEIPSVEVAFKTLLELHSKSFFSDTDYAKVIFELYSQSEWHQFISSRFNVFCYFLQTDKLQFLDGIRLSHKMVEKCADKLPEKLDLIKSICQLPAICICSNKEFLPDYRRAQIPVRRLRNHSK